MQWSLPQKRVLSFAKDGRAFVYLDGSTQSGKTYSMCYSMVYHVASNVWPRFGFDGFLIGSPRASQRQMLIRTIEEACRDIGYPFKAYANGQADIGRHRINGCVMGRKESRAAFHGGRYGLVMIDEVTLCDKETVQFAQGRITRPPRANPIGKLFTSTNPDSPHHWWKATIDEEPRAHIQFRVDDNPSHSQEVKDRFKRIWSGTMLQRMYYGEWVGHAGLVYPLFMEQCVHDNYPEGDPIGYDISVDHATASITHAIVIAVWPTHRRIVDEWHYNADDSYSGALTTYEQSMALKNKFAKYMPFRHIYCDSAAAHMIIDMEKTLGPVLEVWKRVLPGIQQCMVYFGQGFVSVDKEKCEHTVREMSGYAWDSKAAERGQEDVPLKKNDHAPDALRYYLFSEAQFEPVRISPLVS